MKTLVVLDWMLKLVPQKTVIPEITARQLSCMCGTILTARNQEITERIICNQKQVQQLTAVLFVCAALIPVGFLLSFLPLITFGFVMTIVLMVIRRGYQKNIDALHVGINKSYPVYLFSFDVLAFSA